LAAALENLAALVNGNRLLQRHLAFLESLDDRFQLLDRTLEGQPGNIGMGIFGHEHVSMSRRGYIAPSAMRLPPLVNDTTLSPASARQHGRSPNLPMPGGHSRLPAPRRRGRWRSRRQFP